VFLWDIIASTCLLAKIAQEKSIMYTTPNDKCGKFYDKMPQLSRENGKKNNK